MNLMPLDVGPIHFVGIGGIGMSGIAEILLNLGYRVQGSDISENANVRRLRERGVLVSLGHAAANVGEAQVVVVSSAVKTGNPEVDVARARRLPVVRRADMLAELMRLKRSIAIAGTHGKTTTTAMVAAVLDAAGLDPTVINGGIINAYGTNARLGRGDWLVAESDESDGSFLRLPATIGVVTNIDPEHMDFWPNFEAVRDAYYSFIERLPFYGFGVLCIDHPEVQALFARITDRRVVTYGFSPQADVQALPPRLEDGAEVFDVVARDRVTRRERVIEAMRLSLPGRHNVTNALAAVAIATELDLPEAALRGALAGLQGVKRRFTRTGTVDGITFIDDYGHHPVEIRAVLATARFVSEGKVVAVVQPHRFSRLKNLFDDFCICFGDADIVIVTPVYSAGEQPVAGIDHEALAVGMRDHGQRDVRVAADLPQLCEVVAETAAPGDLVVCLGAGSITAWANELPAMLEAHRSRQAAE